ncbi:cytochrome-c oxidase, cbb3-type subunit III (plasmid) [Parasedimentitalea marina]|uniref:Cbb3-type cytochrome c oxidase subunit n=1 Tax=Parasedimentitalea marina TaxID=2483033 RepID=A0A3T0NA18_9RHOB|nr:cytochrome-c oxidase, cbb3-type subunit III [Parasedimentitalea marina]AZV80829.1 cytochrome-c oxidase, cbb3-type subunit III [Parasedimentitalea marina]
MKPERDAISGELTTGHEWNGIKELNTPMPKAFRIWLWGSIAVAVVMWLLYPTWPFVTDYTRGLLGYSSRSVVTDQVASGQRHRVETFAPFETQDVTTLAQDPTLRPQYEASIGVLYRDNCMVCHGRDLLGQNGFPNLTDGHWLWSGLPDEIEYTLQVGINADHEDTRYAEMPAFGRDEMLEKADIADVVDYVLAISGAEHNPDAVARGGELFAENCSGCHNDDGIGDLESGAPSLVDAAWIYGGTRQDILKTVNDGRAGVMPSWSDRLTEAEIRMLTLYVLWAGQGDD